jgi:hypothetical protein
MSKYKYRIEVFYKCLKSFPGFKKGTIYSESDFEYSTGSYDDLDTGTIFDPEKYPKYFTKITKRKRYKESKSIIREDLSSLLCSISPTETPFYSQIFGNKKGVYEWQIKS